MNALEQAISENEAAVIAAVLDALPVKFAQSRIVEKDKEVQMLENELENPCFEEEIQTEIIDPEKQIEIVDGKIEVKEMAGAKSGGIAARIIVEVGIHVKANKLGRLYTPDTTFVFGANNRMPDVSFVSAARIPADGEPVGKWNFAPDLAVEVVSPTDSVKKIRGRLDNFFAADVAEVWIVEPEVGVLSVYHEPLKPTQILTKNETLIGSLVLPDFELDLNQIFID